MSEQPANDDSAERIRRLEGELARQETINRALMERVERSVNAEGGSYSLFERSVVLQGAAQRLSRANAQLSATIETLDRTRADLVQSAKMAALGELVGGVTHEVNTPIGLAYTIVTHLQEHLGGVVRKLRAGELMMDDLEKFLALAEESLNLAEGNLNRAAELIESFKQVAVDRAGGAHRRFDLARHLKEIASSVRSVLRKGRHHLEIDIGEPIVFDSYPGALNQVVTNIVMNAVKHGFDGRTGGRIRIAGRLAEGGQCTITLADDGKGMPAAVASRVFEPFFTTSRNQGGSGLGMSIVHDLVTRRLGGRIDLLSVPDEGTTFTLVLPLCLPEPVEGTVAGAFEGADRRRPCDENT